MFDEGPPREDRRRLPSIILTPRETDILLLLADGKTDHEISRTLNITSKTVNYHVEKMKKLFEAQNRIQLVAIALRRGYID